MKEIQLTQGQVALIDDEDFALVNQYNWFARKARSKFYAMTWVGDWKDRKPLHLHRLIAGNPLKNILIDHIDRNGLNNQKANLRMSDGIQNSRNRSAWGTSKYLGVARTDTTQGIKWRASIGKKYLGIFKTETEAANAYNVAATEKYGAFANLNDTHLPEVLIAELDNSVNAIIISPS